MPSLAADHPLDPFERQLHEHWDPQSWNDVSLLIAVSGGPDSVALLRAICRIAAPGTYGRIAAAHFNHGWRGEASDKDEVFVRSMCNRLGITCHVGRAIGSSQKEEVARTERYEFLRRTAEKNGHRYLVVAHTADDQAETVLHRIIRGTGLRGLRGIPARRRLTEAVTLVRPMLWARRQNVIEYLQRIDQTYHQDPSNEDQRFTRNQIRHDLLPHLAQHYNTSIVEALLRLAAVAAESTTEISRKVAQKLDRLVVSRNDDAVEIDRVGLLSCSPFLQREIFAALWRKQSWPEQSMTFEHWHQIVEVVATETTIMMPGNVRVESKSKSVLLKRTID